MGKSNRKLVFSVSLFGPGVAWVSKTQTAILDSHVFCFFRLEWNKFNFAKNSNFILHGRKSFILVTRWMLSSCFSINSWFPCTSILRHFLHLKWTKLFESCIYASTVKHMFVQIDSLKLLFASKTLYPCISACIVQVPN